jgi:hypothetical protein
MKKSEFNHYYVFKNLFIDYNDAFQYCEDNLLPSDFIVTTKYYIN